MLYLSPWPEHVAPYSNSGLFCFPLPYNITSKNIWNLYQTLIVIFKAVLINELICSFKINTSVLQILEEEQAN